MICRPDNTRGPKTVFWFATLLAAGVSLFVAADGKRPPPAKDPWSAPARAAQRKSTVPSDPASIAAGKAIYAKNCTSCHGKTGLGDGPGARDLDVDPGMFNDKKFTAQTDGELFWKITEGRKPMPKYGAKLTEEERWQVINYVRTFSAGDAPAAK